jgi:hypothetical protein
MRMVIAFFIALVAIPIAQVAIDRWSDRTGPHLLGESRSGLTMEAGKHHRARDLEFFTVPKLERRPKTG